MRPELFRILDVGAPSYFILLLVGFAFATAIAALWARRIGQDPDVMVDLGLAALLVGVLGARLLHVVADGYFLDYVNACVDPSKVDWHIERPECERMVEGLFGAARPNGVWDEAKGVCHPAERNCFAWAQFWSGGLTYYGGFAAAIGSSYWLLRRDRFPFWKAADMAGFVIPLGLAFGRMGCLLAGCCYGTRTGSALALVFPPHSPASTGQFKQGILATSGVKSLPVHPTQLYEAALSLGIAVFCLAFVHARKRYDGQVFLAFVALYATARFLLEFWRDDDRGGLFGLSTSQLLGVVCVAAAVFFHRRLASRASASARRPAT